MRDPNPILCSKCSGEVTAGTLFCWRHAASPPKVGEFATDHGQLLWRATQECEGRQERLLAIFVDGTQVAVRGVEEVTTARPARLLLDVSDPASSGATTAAFVDLSAILEAIVAGQERIETLSSR